MGFFQPKFIFFLWNICTFPSKGLFNVIDSYDVLEYFPEVKDDASEITWGHGINSQKELQQAIESHVLMLEADISSSLINNVIVPIMAHPPINVSDITLQQWLDKALSVRAGIKLDFKDLEVIEPSLKILKNIKTKINKPLWLNADIIEGPINSSTKSVEALSFLNLCQNYFPESTLSIGWTTFWSKDKEEKGFYSWGQILKMVQIIQYVNVTQAITFSIRAVFIRRSIPQIKFILDVIPGSTLTIWSGINDILDVKDLLYLRSMYKRNRIFYDLPHPLLKEFSKKKNYRFLYKEILQNYNFKNLWLIQQNKSTIYIGSETVIVPMDGTELISKRIYWNSLSITGRISYIGSLTNWNINFEFQSQHDFNAGIHKQESGIYITFNKSQILMSKTQTDCLNFEIIYNKNMDDFEINLQHLQCGNVWNDDNLSTIYNWLSPKLLTPEENKKTGNYIHVKIESKHIPSYIILEHLNIKENVRLKVGNNQVICLNYNVTTLVILLIIGLYKRQEMISTI